MLKSILGDGNHDIYMAILVLAAFIVTFVSLKAGKKLLPKDQGRKFAVNGALSEGKPRGAGIILISAFTILTALIVPLNTELIIYLGLIYISMLSGFFDDAAKVPWGELKKGIIDLVVSFGASFTYYHYNGSEVTIALVDKSFTIPAVIFVILGAVLVWASINVTNCSDGVDGLCGTLCIVSFSATVIILGKMCGDNEFSQMIILMIMCLSAYLWYNASPSKLLMGDAGSRALGTLMAIALMKTTAPFLFFIVCFMLIIDGGLGLIKLSFRRYLRMKNFMENIRTPIHDHMRKNLGWSDTQVVFRLAIIQLVAVTALIAYL